jgi:hypothetical protein
VEIPACAGAAAATPTRPTTRVARLCGLRGSREVCLRDGRCCSLPLKRRGHVDLHAAAAKRIERRCRRPPRGIGRDRHGLRATGERRILPAADREPDDRSGDREIVVIAHFDNGTHCRLLLNDVDGVFAFNDNDFQLGWLRRLCVTRRRLRLYAEATFRGTAGVDEHPGSNVDSSDDDRRREAASNSNSTHSSSLRKFRSPSINDNKAPARAASSISDRDSAQ